MKLFSGCSSTREQCRATTWCLKKRTWRLPTKVDLKKKKALRNRSQRAAASLWQFLCSTQLLQGSVWTSFRLGTLKPTILFSQTCYVYWENPARRRHHSSFHFWVATLMAFLCAHIPDPRFADYGKVELVFSEGPEKIPGTLLTFFLHVARRRGSWKSRQSLFLHFSLHAAPFLPLCPLVRRDVECCRVEM